MRRRDTIAAIATAPGRAGIGIVRVSGNELTHIIHGAVGRKLKPRFATAAVFLGADGLTIDEGIALLFEAPASYTGENVLELQGHGGPVVLNAVLHRCIQLGARLAEPGEFTQRAFLNGKLDLLQAEGVIDLIDASTTEAAKTAVRSLKGEFSQRIDALNRGIAELRTRVEAALDFPEEEVDALDRHAGRERLEELHGQLSAVAAAAQRGSLLREGMRIVLAGAPNVGKSTLLNRLAGEDLAIVSDIPGTTRDPIRQSLDLEGLPVHVIDTAGLRATDHPVEQIGIERAWAEIETADLLLVIADARKPELDDPALGRIPAGMARIIVLNKIDLTAEPARLETSEKGMVVRLSAKSGTGVDLLRRALLDTAGWKTSSEPVFLARARHLAALEDVRRHLGAAAASIDAELFAEELRLAHVALASMTGSFTADDLLGEIFQRFCIGK